LETYEVQQCSTIDVFTKYDTILRDFVIEHAGDMEWCPQNNCGNVLVRENKLSMMIYCYKCKYSWCTKCDVPWHSDLTCSQYHQMLAEERKQLELKEEKEKKERWEREVDGAKNQFLFQTWVQKNAKVCNNCGQAIEKNGGCNHMTCSRCRAEFCWLCRKKWKACNCMQFT